MQFACEGAPYCLNNLPFKLQEELCTINFTSAFCCSNVQLLLAAYR